MTEHERRELEPPALLLSRGSLGPDVKRLQEWLCLHGFHTAVDGDFGPATEAALKAWQHHDESEHDWPGAWTYGEVNQAVWHGLVAPLRRVAMITSPQIGDHGARIVAVAERHHLERPREVGGPNAGPWVRLYMDGHEGKDWPWCAGFVTTVLRQALGHDRWRTFSCDELGIRAKREARLVHLTRAHEMLTPGSIFLVRSFDGFNDWVHCGIVTAVATDYFETIEGNTNTDGSREGTAVHARVRAFKANVDFVLTGGDR